jgi:hypothetical protein
VCHTGVRTAIDQLIELGASLTCLSKRQYKLLLVIEEVSRQQREMWSEKKTRVDQRIVSLSQPHLRPIVRGKAGKPTEFGAKLSVSCVDNYVRVPSLITPVHCITQTEEPYFYTGCLGKTLMNLKI